MLDSFTRPLGLSAQREGYHHFGLLDPRTSEMQRLTRWYDEGKLGQGQLGGGVPVDSTFVLESDERAWAAMARQKSRRATGKIVVSFPQ